MVVEALYWFHPLVWWIETRLVDERERACDEEVLRKGNEPGVYAEGIVNVCKFYAESPMVCASSVTGAELTQRIEAIMRNEGRDSLNVWRRGLLVTTAIVGLAGPLVVGILNAPLRAQSLLAFEVASVKLNKSGDANSSSAPTAGGGFAALSTSPSSPPRTQPILAVVNAPPVQAQAPIAQSQPAGSSETLRIEVASIRRNTSGEPGPQFRPQSGGFNVRAIPANLLLQLAYGVQDFQVSGGPRWMDTDQFDVVIKLEDATGIVSPDRIKAVLPSLLAERFQLKIHRETKDEPIYTLPPCSGIDFGIRQRGCGREGGI